TRSGLGPMGGSSGGWRVAASTVTMNRRARFRQQKERVIPPALAGRRTARAPRRGRSAPAGRKVVKKALHLRLIRCARPVATTLDIVPPPAKARLKAAGGFLEALPVPVARRPRKR